MSTSFVNVAIPALLCIVLGWNLTYKVRQVEEPKTSGKRRKARVDERREFQLVPGGLLFAFGIGALLIDIVIRLAVR